MGAKSLKRGEKRDGFSSEQRGFSFSLSSPRHARALCSAIILISLAIRLLYVYSIREDLFSKTLIIDPKFYDTWARKILTGTIEPTGAYYQDPVYAFFLAACYKLFGYSSQSVRIVQAFLDTGTVALLCAMGAMAFSPLTAWLSALIACFYGPMVYYTGLLDKTTLTTFLLALSLWLFAMARKRTSQVLLGISGAVLGLATLTRGNLLFVTLGFLIWLFLQRNTGALMRSIKMALAFLIGVLCVICPVTIRNYRASHDFVPITANAGLNFYLGNNPHTAGNYLELHFLHGIPELEFADSKVEAERISGKTFYKASAVSNFWMHQGIDFITQHPDLWFALIGRKILLLINNFEIPETYSYYYFKNRFWPLQVPFITFGIIFPLGLLGMVLYYKRDVERGAGLSLFLLIYALSMLLFFITSRYRFPIVIPLIVFAARFLDGLFFEPYSPEKSRILKPMSVILASLFLACYWVPDWMKIHVVQPGLSSPYTVKGFMLMDSGDINGAIKDLEQSRKLYPNGFAVYGYLGDCYTKVGRNDEAISAYVTALAHNPEYHEAYNNLASLFYKKGNLPLALQSIQQALRIRPDIPQYQANYQFLSKLTRRGAAMLPTTGTSPTRQARFTPHAP